MEQIKHLILVRFYCQELSLNIFDNNLLKLGYENLIKFLIPSLNNQTNLNFTLILMKHKNSDFLIQKYNELKNICKFEIKIIDFDKINEYIENLNINNLILSRIDNDDCIKNDLVDLIQNKIHKKCNISFYGFARGYTQYTNKMYELYDFFVPYDKGAMSIMETIYCNWSIYKINPYQFNHIDVLPFLKKYTDINDNNFICNTTDKAFIYNQTGINDHLKNSSQTEWGKVVKNIDKKIINKLFGI